MAIPTGSLFYDPRIKPLSTTGQPQSGCYYCFFLTGTTTLANVYSDGLLTTPLSQPAPAAVNPVGFGTVSASDGRFVPIYLNPNVTYRAQLYSAAGLLLEDTDPCTTLIGGLSQALIGAILYPRTAAEITAGITPTNLAYPAGDVRRYGAAGDGVTDDSAAVSNAAVCNKVVTFAIATYFMANVNLTQPVTFQGMGQSQTILLDKIQTNAGNSWSQNMFTDTAPLAYVEFKDLTFNGGCSANGYQLAAWNVAMVQLTQTTRIRCENVTVTGYSASAFGIPAAVTAQFFQAFSLYNATQVDLVNVTSTNNYFPQIQVYFTPTSNGVCNIERCKLINPSGGTAFQTFLEVIGGNPVVTDCYCLNGRTFSWMNFEVSQSLNVKGCRFIRDDGGSVDNAICINVGQSTFPYNNNITIEQNYFQNVGQPISVGPGTNVVIRDNIIKHAQLQSIQVQANSTSSFAVYNALFPAYPAGAFAISTNVTISGNKIFGGATTANSGYAIGVLDDVVNGAFGWQNVNISDNEILTDQPNNFMHFFAVRLRDTTNVTMERNTLGYGIDAVWNDGTCNGFNFKGNTLIPINYLGGVAQSADDIVFSGFAPTNVVIERNNFSLFPPGGNRYNINFVVGVTGASILDNQGMKQSFPVNSTAATDYVIRNTKQKRVTAAPAAGNWGVGDVVFSVPATATPQEWDCTSAGSFAVLAGVTFSYTSGNSFATLTAGTGIVVGARVSIVKGVDGVNPLIACVLFISGSTIFLDSTFGSTQVSQPVTIVNPVFHAAANFA